MIIIKFETGYHWESGSTINEKGTKNASSVCVNILFLNLGGNYMGIKNTFTCYTSLSIGITCITKNRDRVLVCLQLNSRNFKRKPLKERKNSQ